MNQYLKSYQVTMRAAGPVFIGSGKEIGKKEYVFLNRRQVGIPNIELLYKELSERKKEKKFEDYLLGRENRSLTDWLEQQNVKRSEIEPLLKYTLDCGDAVLEKGANRLQIMACIKDAYGMPYIPGSSLKGMFRTILLGADIAKHPEKYRNEKRSMSRTIFDQNGFRTNRKYFLSKEMQAVEGAAYRTLERPRTKPADAVNDLMQGFVVSDSEPLTPDDLVLCQKIDRHPDGEERRLPLLRECIKPDTRIRFTITIDTSICKLEAQGLLDAMKFFADSYYKNFGSAFAGMDVPKSNFVFCGGGCGFVSKTVIYPLYGKKEGIEAAQQIFDKTKVPRVHKHNRDKQYGASPHTIKCSRYQGRTLQMGMCEIEKIEAI